MLTQAKTLHKIKRIEENYYPLIFKTLFSPHLEYTEYTGFQTKPDEAAAWRPFVPLTQWGSAGGSAWVRCTVEIPKEYKGVELFLQFDCGAVETLVSVDGVHKGLFNNQQTEEGTRSNHHTVRILSANESESKYNVSLLMQIYAGHMCVGTQPYDNREVLSKQPETYQKKMKWCRVVQIRDLVKDFVFELRTLRLLAEATHDPFVQGKIYKVFNHLFATVDQAPLTDENILKEILIDARAAMKPIFDLGASSGAPLAGIIGHSHMDTAWLWTSEETIRKCARTYSAALNYMEQYPDYLFVQSSPIHAEMMRQHYPEIFERIKHRALEGRWEPNGGMYVEADCNIPSGESLIRQFLKGQRYTQKHFNYTADTFWLPDTFGYSAALPQILKGASVKYFCTTKLSWNETNAFPYDTFHWKGIDGSGVTVHFNDIHSSPNPANLITKMYGDKTNNQTGIKPNIRHTDVSDRRLISFGLGDGGGGPDFDMLEEAQRSQNLPGCPRAKYTTVGNFMKGLSETSTNLPVYQGELYLELHRGTLTQMAAIKRYNRKLEQSLSNIEKLLSLALIKQITVNLSNDDFKIVDEAYDTLLLNQFHDILPGTSIAEENERAVRDYKIALTSIKKLTENILMRANIKKENYVTIFNPLPWKKEGTLLLRSDESNSFPEGIEIAGAQHYQDIDGNLVTVLCDVNLPPLGFGTFPVSSDIPIASKVKNATYVNKSFKWDTEILETPFYKISFDDAGYISSLYDREAKREVRGSGAPLGTYYFGEDIPAAWDNWDIDYDQHLKMKPVKTRASVELVSAGESVFVLRQKFKISNTSSLTQDIIFYSDNKKIDFECSADWNEKQKLLKVSFDVNVKSSRVKNEIQFGYLERPTHENTTYDKSKFEVSNHKWSDLSESRYGVALLNDCKYGISVKNSDMQLTLLKAGAHPDPNCDRGVHKFTYSLLPHRGDFSTNAVIRPAYELNTSFPAIVGKLNHASESFLKTDVDNVIFETLKPVAEALEEDPLAMKTASVILRGYETEGSLTKVRLFLSGGLVKIIETDLLENTIAEIPIEREFIELEFHPFEIKTYKLFY